MDSENGRMTRREYRAQLGLDTETPEKREKSRDAGARLILLQSVICAAMLCLLFGIRKLSPANFETLKNGYKSVMRYSMDAREAWGKIKSAVGFVFEPAGALANNESASESSTESLGNIISRKPAGFHIPFRKENITFVHGHSKHRILSQNPLWIFWNSTKRAAQILCCLLPYGASF